MIQIESRLQEIKQQYPNKGFEIIRHAVTLAQLTGSEQTTPDGISCLEQGLAMAEILTALQVDSETLAAAIVYNSVQYAELSLEDVEDHLGPKVSKLIQSTRQMDGISELHEAVARHEYQHPKIDNIRKMLLAMIDDVRAVLIKLAERLCVLRNAKTFNNWQRQQLAQETMAIYAPLANRLGIGHIKWELEDLAFSYLQPEKYQQISQALNQHREDREKDVQKVIAVLTTMLQKAGIKNMQITGRVKHIYSIYQKMQRKNVDFNEIYDATAVRVTVSTIEDCYAVLSNVHSTWKHIAKEFDDYIATPKENSYKSIHTAIIGPNNKNIEIQIRTYDMHDEAELGVAAHWVYKEGIQKSSDYKAKIAWLRQVIDWQKEVTQHRIFDDRVYVFTPNNDIIELPQEATVLDFAYQIHSEIGHRCRGAKVDGNIVNLTYKPKTGEHIEILTSKQARPSRDWLNPHLEFLKTSRAKAKIHHWFKKQDYEQNITLGQELLDKEFRRLGLKNININNLANKLDFKNSDDLLAALGCGDLKLGSIVNLIQRDFLKKSIPEIPPTIIPSVPITKKPTDIEIQGVDNLLTNIANCCQPIPGDSIIGYITQGRGVSIHRQDCFNILRSKQTKPERLIEVCWGSNINRYPVNLIIEAYDHYSLAKDITNIIANENVSIVGLNLNVSKKDSIAYVNLTVETENLTSLDRIVTKIKRLPNVIEVKR